MKTSALDEFQVIENALQRLAWTEQRRYSQLLQAHDLTLPQFLVLASIKRRGSGCPIGALADEMLQAYPTMTGIVDRLEQAGLVVRERGTAADRRQVVVRLTPVGQELLHRAHGARRHRMVQALARFSAHDRREFLRLLTSYLETYQKEPE